MNRNVIIGAIVAVVLIVGGILLFKPSNKKDNSTNQNTNTSPSTSQPSAKQNTNPSNGQVTNSAATITYTDSGFEPSSLTVKAGTKITVKNNASDDLQFSSDPHPVHTDDPELNQSVISSGQSATFTVKTTGTHGYHNHLDPSDTGTLIVQ